MAKEDARIKEVRRIIRHVIKRAEEVEEVEESQDDCDYGDYSKDFDLMITVLLISKEGPDDRYRRFWAYAGKVFEVLEPDSPYRRFLGRVDPDNVLS